MAKNMGERICESKEYNILVSDSKKQKNRDKHMSKKLKEMKKENVQVVFILVLVVLAILTIVFLAIKLNKDEKITLTDDTILTTLNINKYSEEIKAMYNREGQKDLFIKEMDRLQNLVGTYLVENLTISEDSLEKISKQISKELKKDTWDNILDNRSTYYVGDYSVDDKVNIKFKFKSKSIEPDWVDDEDVNKYIILN